MTSPHNTKIAYCWLNKANNANIRTSNRMQWNQITVGRPLASTAGNVLRETKATVEEEAVHDPSYDFSMESPEDQETERLSLNPREFLNATVEMQRLYEISKRLSRIPSCLNG